MRYPFLLIYVNSHSPALLYGGALAAAAVCTFLLVRRRLPLLPTLDTLAAPLSLLLAMNAVGDFASGARFGSAALVPWAVRFHSPTAHMWSGIPLDTPLHPVQLYDAAFNLVLCAILLYLIRAARHPGELFGAWLFLTGLANFVLEFYRGERGVDFFAGLLDSVQVLSLAMLLAGAMLWMRFTERRAPYAR